MTEITMAKMIDIETTLRGGASLRGAWNAQQFALIGIAWPPYQGWREDLRERGFQVTAQTHTKFVALKTDYAEGSKGVKKMRSTAKMVAALQRGFADEAKARPETLAAAFKEFLEEALGATVKIDLGPVNTGGKEA